MEEMDSDSDDCIYPNKILHKKRRHSLYLKYENLYRDTGCAFLHFLGRLRL